MWVGMFIYKKVFGIEFLDNLGNEVSKNLILLIHRMVSPIIFICFFSC